MSLDRKMKPCYLGPMVVITRNKGGVYIVAEMDGSVWHEKVGAFRLVLYFARHKIYLPRGIEEFVDIAKKTLDELKESDDTEKSQPDIWFENVRHIPLDKNKTHLPGRGCMLNQNSRVEINKTLTRRNSWTTEKSRIKFKQD